MSSEEYNRGYGDGYQAGIRDAQIEVRQAFVDLDGARRVTIHGYDTDEDVSAVVGNQP